MTGSQSAAEPRGYSLLLPDGWSRYRVNAEGRREFRARAMQRMRALGRPDLDVQVRLLIDEQWRELERSHSYAVYLPDRETVAWRPPVSIAVRKLAAVEGREFESAVRERYNVVPETLTTPIGPLLRWRSTHRGSGDWAEVQTVTLGYGFPAPAVRSRLGLVFVAVMPHPDDVDPAIIEGSVELIDTIMETFRWR